MNDTGDTIGLAHTRSRWTKRDAKTDNYAHDHHHCDYKNRLVIVHKGRIKNAQLIKGELQARGISFKSQRDAELIVHLVSYYLDSRKQRNW